MRKNLQRFKLLLACSIVIISSCKKAESISDSKIPTDTTNNPAVNALIGMHAPEAFNYQTVKDVVLDITILGPDNTAIPYIPISIMSKAQELGGVVLFTSLTDNNGKISGSVKLPSYIDQIVIDPKYSGVIRNAAINIVNNAVTCTLGGSGSYTGNVVLNSPLSGRVGQNMSGNTLRPLSIPYGYMGTYDNQGKPNYLEVTNQVISTTFLANINTSLPETKSVAILHPDYLSNTKQTNLDVTILSDIYFTFVSEGASFKSAIAYFTFPTGNPPQNISQIDSLHIVLPNASLTGSGGSLQPGNTIKLGRFAPGISIGFALMANAWTGTADNSGYWTNYTIDQLNPASAANLKRQSVLLYDNSQSLFLVGFEDIRRDYASCDNDFNDCLFYIKSSEVNAISTQNVNKIDAPTDTDGDGVSDVNDAFPTDPTRAYINYYPGPSTTSTVVFEDNWPFLGDYDFNDLVVGYRYTIISNAQNSAVEIKANYVLKDPAQALKMVLGYNFLSLLLW